MGKRKITIYSEDFRRSSARLAVTSEQPIKYTANDLGISDTTLHDWVKKFEPNHHKRSEQQKAELTTDETQELKRLRKENTRLRQERDILKKATAYFANQTQ